MKWDELLLCAVLVMLIASTYMGYCIQRALYHYKEVGRHVITGLGDFGIALHKLDERVRELENERGKKLH
jgi:hypothetical protein